VWEVTLTRVDMDVFERVTAAESAAEVVTNKRSASNLSCRTLPPLNRKD